MRSLITAFRTLTILPIPGNDTTDFTRSLPWFPLVGLVIAALLAAVGLVGSRIMPHEALLVALMVLCIHVLITGALHLDGIADVSDAFGGGKTRERILEILRDSRHGTFGVCALFFVLAAKLLLYGRCIEEGTMLPLVAAVVGARVAMALFPAFLPYTGREGGTASVFKNPNRTIAVLSALIATLGGVLFINPILLSLMLAAGMVAAILFGWLCIKKLGGINGDCIGAVGELVEIAMLLAWVGASSHL